MGPPGPPPRPRPAGLHRPPGALPGPRRRLSGRFSVGELFEGDDWSEPRSSRPASPRLRLGPGDRAVVRRRVAVADGPAGGGLRTGPLAATSVLSNHDQPRHASRLAKSAGTDDVDAIAKAAALLLLTLRRDAVPVLRRGARNGRRGDPAARDHRPAGPLAGPDFPWWNRDQCRTPMAWTGARRRLHDRPAVDPDRRRRSPPERGRQARRGVRPGDLPPTPDARRGSRHCAGAGTSRSTRVRRTCWRGVARPIARAPSSWSTSRPQSASSLPRGRTPSGRSPGPTSTRRPRTATAGSSCARWRA